MSRALSSTGIRAGQGAGHGTGRVLVVSDDASTISMVDSKLSEQGYEIQVASKGNMALELVSHNQVDFVLIDIDSIDMDGEQLIFSIRIRVDDMFVPIVVLSPAGNDTQLSRCLNAGCDDFILKPFTSTELAGRLSSLDQVRELKGLYKSSLNEQLVAKQILSYALSERNLEFEEIKSLSKSKAVFSGDLFLTTRSPENNVHILFSDFTGHGLSAAIGALPVADIFSVMSSKGFNIEDILENINNKLHTLLPVSMFMACVIIEIDSKNNKIRLWNGGMPDIYIRDGVSGNVKEKISSSHIPLGISDSSECDFQTQVIDTDVTDQLIIFSDGLTDANNTAGDMFGYEHIDRCLSENIAEKSVFSSLVDCFNRFCGGVNPDDDVTLACIPCTDNLTQINDVVDLNDDLQVANSSNGNWCWYMELSGASLRNVNPVPIIINEAYKISGHNVDEDKLSSVLTVLYDNAIVHGLADDNIDDFSDSNIQKVSNNFSRIKEPKDDSYLRIGLKKIDHLGENALLVSIEDSGDGFDHVGLMEQLVNRPDNIEVISDGIPLVYELSDSLSYIGKGNRVEAVISGCV